MTSRVGRVAVKLRLAETERAAADATRRTVEHVVLQHALDELERVVHARLGTAAIVRVRRLAFRSRIARGELEHSDTALAIGRELARSILDDLDALPPPQRLRPVAAANAVVFADQDHAVAAFLADAAEQRSAWFHPPGATPAQVWTAVQVAGVGRAAAIREWLARMDASAAVEQLVASVSRQTVEAVDVRVDPPPLRRASVAPAERHADLRAIDAPVSPPAVPTDTVEVTDQTPVTAGETVTPVEPPAIEDRVSVGTEAAGVFYLARLVLQLDLGEHLWAIGVREGDFLAHIAAAILGGPPDDPAWRWFGGAFDREPMLESIPDWAAAELSTNLADSLARELARSPGAGQGAGLAPSIVGDLRTASAIADCATAICRLLCARLGRDLDVACVRAVLSVPGILELAPGTLRVMLPMAAVDLDLRRAGLDFDPGHVPWLGRTVELVFVPESSQPT